MFSWGVSCLMAFSNGFLSGTGVFGLVSVSHDILNLIVAREREYSPYSI